MTSETTSATVAYVRGHEVVFDGEVWRYADDGSPVGEPTTCCGPIAHLHDDRPCVHCGMVPTPEGYDPCIGYIPGARAACCGHGDDSLRYVLR